MTKLRTWAGSNWRVMAGGVPDLRVPTKPLDLAVTSTSGQLELAWKAPYDSGGTVLSGYRLTINPGNLIQNLGAGATSTIVSGLSNGTPYTVDLVARNSVGDSEPAETIASPTGPWVLGGTGSLMGAPVGWGGNGGVNNLRGAYAATEPPAGVTNGHQMSAAYCGVLPVLQAQNKTYADLTPINTNGTFFDANGVASGVTGYDPGTGRAFIEVTRDGAVLEYLDINGQIFVEANNVIIRYCRINAEVVDTAGSYIIKTYTQYSGLIVQYCEIICGQGISSAIPPYGEYIARYCDVWNVSNDAFKVGSNTLVEYNWVHALKKAPGAHADAIQWTAGDNIYVHHNRLELYEGPAVESYQIPDLGNGATQVGKMAGNGTWFAFEDNFAEGYSYTLRAGNVSPDAKGWITEHCFWRRNRIGRRFSFGPLYTDIQAGADQIVDSTNVWHESGMTYTYQTSTGLWFYAEPVVAGQPCNTWSSTRNGQVT